MSNDIWSGNGQGLVERLLKWSYTKIPLHIAIALLFLSQAGIVLALFGGANTGIRSEEDRIPIRGDSHILIVGDPGLGKSQILRSASRLAPRGVYVCGNTSTSSGLTVTLSRCLTNFTYKPL